MSLPEISFEQGCDTMYVCICWGEAGSPMSFRLALNSQSSTSKVLGLQASATVHSYMTHLLFCLILFCLLFTF